MKSLQELLRVLNCVEQKMQDKQHFDITQLISQLLTYDPVHSVLLC